MATVVLTAAGSQGDGYSWAIEKTADTTEVTIRPGEQVTVGYAVTATPTLIGAGWSATGEVTVANDQESAALLDAVAVEVTEVGPAEVSCSTGLPEVLAPGQRIACEWSIALPDGGERVATATAGLNGVELSATAAIGFEGPTGGPPTDRCADVHDLNVGFLGMACAGAGPTTFAFPVTFGPFEECPVQGLENVAWLETADTKTVSEAGWNVRVVCAWPPGDQNERTYHWRIEKSVNPAAVVLGAGERAEVTYAIIVASTGSTDSNPGAPVTSELDECVEVSDSEVDDVLGTVCIGDEPRTCSYVTMFGPYEDCGPRTIPNTATYRGNDTGASGDAVAVLEIDVLC